ncbi:TetR/AcrR family transcriptional regulator [Leucobacter chromiireducens]|uniref:TetR/AcrR family transcriptional regulator n=1 Tax=Leucobacter chromiireducens TaxID=283877 RepID=UPI000F633137|nr:TetR/AcrR family transcriptional regulator [Leucobacter chromiireducens]
MATQHGSPDSAGHGEQKLRDAAKALAEAAGQLGQSLGVAGASAETGVTKGLLAAAQALAQASAWVEQRAKPLSTREQLLVQAARLFAERGFSGVSLEDIAQAAGFTKGAVYSHFGSKEQVFLAAVRHTVERMEEELAAAEADIAAGAAVAPDAGGGEGEGEAAAGDTAASETAAGDTAAAGLFSDSAHARAELASATTLGIEALLFGRRVPEHRAEVRELSAALISVLVRADERLRDDSADSGERVLAREESRFAVLALRALLAGIADQD